MKEWIWMLGVGINIWLLKMFRNLLYWFMCVFFLMCIFLYIIGKLVYDVFLLFGLNMGCVYSILNWGGRICMREIVWKVVKNFFLIEGLILIFVMDYDEFIVRKSCFGNFLMERMFMKRVFGLSCFIGNDFSIVLVEIMEVDIMIMLGCLL